MEVIGYKCFNKGLVNSYGKRFYVGETYVVPGKVKHGNHGNGFHLCKNMEDTFRYFKAFEEDVDVCLVRGSGEIKKFCDEYYGYYDMYCVQKLEILEQLSRFEIIENGLQLDDIKGERFVSTFQLTKDEIQLFKEKYKSYERVLNAIAYYQEGNKTIYEESTKKL